jgi:hypothetical protein
VDILKNSVFTGDHIYNHIKGLSDDVIELNRAMDELDKGSLPYNLLDEAYESKKRELIKARNAEFTA